MDEFGDVIDSGSDLLSQGIQTLGTVGIRDGVAALNGYTGVYGDPGVLYPQGVVPVNGAPVGAQPASQSNLFFLLILGFAAWKFLG